MSLDHVSNLRGLVRSGGADVRGPGDVGGGQRGAVTRRVARAAIVGLLLLASVPAKALPVLDFTGGFEASAAQGSTFGWRFAVSAPLDVAALGIFDFLADGFGRAHAIGLWTESGTLLRSGAITNTNSTPLVSTSNKGVWRTIPVPVLTLGVGVYVIGATYESGDADLLIENAAPTTVPGVLFGTATLTSGDGLLFPTTDEPGVSPGYFGPNIFTPSDVTIPEPSSLLLLGSAMLGAVALGRRKGEAR